MAGDGAEFEGAVMPALDALHSLSRRLTRGSGSAEELCQETLTRAWTAWVDGRRPDRVGPWLATICLNVARDRARRPSREAPWPDELDPPARTDVEAEAIARVQRDLVDRALAKLPYEQRLAITLMDVCGLTAAETAQVTGSPRGTVLARVHRGRKALARSLADRPDARTSEGNLGDER